MANNPASRRAGASRIPAANKIVRGRPQAVAIETASKAVLQTADATSGGGGGGGGGGGSTTPSGPAGGDLGGTYPSPYVNQLTALTSMRQTPLGYPTGGTINLRFDLGSYDYIPLSTNVVFSTSFGMIAGSVQELELYNATGGALTLTANANWKATADTLPTSLAAGQRIKIVLRSTGTTDSAIFYEYNKAIANTAVTPGAYGNYDRVGAFQVQADGRLIAASDILIQAKGARSGAVLRAPAQRVDDIYNVKDFGAIGDGTTNDTAAIQAAANALVAASITSAVPSAVGTLYFPDGRYLSDGITFSSFRGRIAVRGSSKDGAEFILRTGGTNAFTVDLTAGGVDARRNGASIYDMSFSVAASVVGWAAWYVYAVAPSVDNQNGICEAVNIRIIGDGTGAYGYVDGISLYHITSFFIDKVYGFGANGTYASTTTYSSNNPSTNIVAGGGALLRLSGTWLNSTVSNIQSNYWNKCISIAMTGTDFFQGLEVCNIVANVALYSIYIKGVGNSGAYNIVNCLLDNGNVPAQSVGYALYVDNAGGFTFSDVYAIANAAGGSGIYVANSGEVDLHDIRLATGNLSKGIHFVNVQDSQVHDVFCTGFTDSLYLDASCQYVKAHHLTDQTTTAFKWSDLGSNNRIVPPLYGAITWDPASLVPGQQDFVHVTVSGARFGQGWVVGVPYDLSNMMANCIVTAADTVRINLYNCSTGTNNLGSGTWTVQQVS